MTCGGDPGSCGLKRGGVQIKSMQATVWPNKTRRNQRNLTDSAPQFQNAHPGRDPGATEKTVRQWVEDGSLQSKSASFAIRMAHYIVCLRSRHRSSFLIEALGLAEHTSLAGQIRWGEETGIEKSKKDDTVRPLFPTSSFCWRVVAGCPIHAAPFAAWVGNHKPDPSPAASSNHPCQSQRLPHPCPQDRVGASPLSTPKIRTPPLTYSKQSENSCAVLCEEFPAISLTLKYAEPRSHIQHRRPVPGAASESPQGVPPTPPLKILFSTENRAKNYAP